MDLFSKPAHVEMIKDMREKWENGEVTTRQYHNFIEKTKRSLAQDSFFRF